MNADAMQSFKVRELKVKITSWRYVSAV